jgi:hypothetical protein
MKKKPSWFYGEATKAQISRSARCVGVKGLVGSFRKRLLSIQRSSRIWVACCGRRRPAPIEKSEQPQRLSIFRSGETAAAIAYSDFINRTSLFVTSNAALQEASQIRRCRAARTRRYLQAPPERQFRPQTGCPSRAGGRHDERLGPPTPILEPGSAFLNLRCSPNHGRLYRWQTAR